MTREVVSLCRGGWKRHYANSSRSSDQAEYNIFCCRNCAQTLQISVPEREDSEQSVRNLECSTELLTKFHTIRACLIGKNILTDRQIARDLRERCMIHNVLSSYTPHSLDTKYRTI